MVPASESTASVPTAPGIPESGDRVKVLLVDDSPEKLLALESVLAAEDLTLVKVESGAEALRRLLRADFALILLDVKMPGMDGFETAHLIRMRKRSEHTPIIFLTSYGAEEAQLARAYSLGAVDFIFFPIEPSILKAKVDAFVDLHRIQRKVSRQAAVLRENATRLRWANRDADRRARALRREIETRKEAEAALEGSRAELRDANALLELKVRERTARLEELNASLQNEMGEKEALLKEIHHRVKNNLQIVSSLLRLQSGKVEDAAVRSLLLEAQNRVMSIALVHDKLYRSRDLGRIDFAGYLRDLARHVFSSLGADERGIGLELDLRETPVAMDFAVPCGLIVQELLANALKHAFPRERAGTTGRPRVKVRTFLHDDGDFGISVEDNGVGPPAGLDLRRTRSLGMQLVYTLAKQMGGKVELGGGEGMSVRILAPSARGKD